MTRTRVLDWFLGALAMLVILVVAAVVLWLVVSKPATDGSTPPATRSTPPPTDVQAPPADLGANEIWLGDVDIASGLVALPGSTLLDVEAQGYGVRSGDDVVVDTLEVQATIPFADVAAEIGGDSRVTRAEDGQAQIERTIEVLGREVEIVATGTVEVRDGLLVVQPRSIDLGGPDTLSRATAALVRQFVTIEQPIEGLPPNLVLEAVAVEEDGFRARLSGQDVVLSDGGS